MLKRILGVALLSAVAGSVVAAPVTYKMDPSHTQINFVYSHFGFSNIHGQIGINDGTVVYDAENPAASSVQVTANVETIHTGVADLDEHLKKADFFDVANHPTATFKSTKVEAAGEGKLKVTGDLTIHGETVSTQFDITINKVGEHPMRKKQAAGFDASGKIDRTAFGVAAYTMATGADVRLHITTEAIAE